MVTECPGCPSPDFHERGKCRTALVERIRCKSQYRSRVIAAVGSDGNGVRRANEIVQIKSREDWRWLDAVGTSSDVRKPSTPQTF